jgi:DNA repair protein NreA
MASKPVDVEISLEDRPHFSLKTDSVMAPQGPNAKLKTAEITSNPKIDSKVEKVVSDTDFRAAPAITYLYERGFDENFLSKLLSVGNVGMKPDRKLVPTRWSITATDDMLAKHIMQEIKDYQQIADYTSYFGSYLGNYYIILLFPEIWSYELFETYMPRASWNTGESIEYTTDYEAYAGRKEYAENCAGGYYSVRLAVLERLRQLKRQASALVIRVITGEYAVPLGVWVTREAARNSLASSPLYFDSKELMLKYASSLAKKKFGIELSGIIGNSILVRQMNTQKKLSAF